MGIDNENLEVLPSSHVRGGEAEVVGIDNERLKVLISNKGSHDPARDDRDRLECRTSSESADTM